MNPNDKDYPGVFGEYVHKRIRENKNFMCCITGATGSGKTYSALRFGERWDKNFKPENIVFTPQDFITLLNGGTLKKGAVIVADEFGVSMNSRNWQSQSNQMLNYILQTFRSKNYIVLFTSPDFGFIDSSARKLFHCHMMTQGINLKKKECTLKPLMLQVNQTNGDIYRKFLQVAFGKKRDIKRINRIDVSLPSKELIKAYEIKKENFVDQLNKEIEEKLFANENKQNNIDKFEIEKKIKINAIAKLREKKTSWEDIANLFEFTTNDSARKWFSRNRTDIDTSSYI